MPPGFSKDGNTVTIQLDLNSYQRMLFFLGQAMALSRMHGHLDLFWRLLEVANKLNFGNPEYTPYEIPEEYKW